MEDLNDVPRNIRILFTIFIPNSKSHFSKLEKKFHSDFHGVDTHMFSSVDFTWEKTWNECKLSFWLKLTIELTFQRGWALWALLSRVDRHPW